MNTLCDMDPASVFKHNPTWLETNRPVDFKIQEVVAKFPEELKADALNMLTQNVKMERGMFNDYDVTYKNSTLEYGSTETRVYADLLAKKGYTVKVGSIGGDQYGYEPLVSVIINGNKVGCSAIGSWEVNLPPHPTINGEVLPCNNEFIDCAKYLLLKK
jgi:hypothetical protein